MVTAIAGCGDSGPPEKSTIAPSSTSTAVTESHRSAIQFREHLPDPDQPFAYRNGEDAERSTILDGMGGGVAVFDYDRDGRMDLLFPGGGQFGDKRLIPLRPELYRNYGNWKFVSAIESAGLNPPTHYSQGVAVSDYDNDGFEDVLITGYGGVQLLRNQGDGTFRDETRDSRIDDVLWSTSAAWGDFNGDGNLDLYLTRYVDWSFDNDPYCPTFDHKRRERCPPQSYGPLPDAIYMSQGDGSFNDASSKCGLRRDGKGLGVVLADIDQDGDLDIYVANDTVANFLYRNDGHARFEEIAVAAGCAFNDLGSPDGSMGVSVSDFDLDGQPDLWTVNYERETIALYKNLGDCNFEYVSQRTGVSVVGTMFVGFGTVFLDADLDGDEDVFVANGHVLRFPNNAPVRQKPLFFENLAGKRFVNVAAETSEYGRETHVGRGVARGDLDADGDLDLAISDLHDPVQLLENVSQTSGQWLKVRLIGVTSNRDAIGARLTLTTSRGSQIRQISSGDSYLSHSDRTVNWGIPDDAESLRLRIDWPNGQIQMIDHQAPNRSLTIHEPTE
ncbi:MAG TPA: CRTAC1 family protein [Schlesneria sp.]